MKWVVRTSSVRVAAKDSDRVYRSMDDVPPDMRTRIQETVEGPNALTILIANHEAYDRITRGVGSRELPAEMQRLKPQPTRERKARKPIRGSDLEWKIALVGGSLAIVGLWALWLWSIRIGTS